MALHLCIKNISSEGKQEEWHDENLIKSVMMLKDEFCNHTSAAGSHGLPGYIQRVQCGSVLQENHNLRIIELRC